MGVLEHVLAGVVHLAVAGLDLAMFLTVASAVSRFSNAWPWTAFEIAGRPLVDPLLERVSGPLPRCLTRIGFPVLVAVVLLAMGVCRLLLQQVLAWLY